jgi:hypothetical protein
MNKKIAFSHEDAIKDYETKNLIDQKRLLNENSEFCGQQNQMKDFKFN